MVPPQKKKDDNGKSTMNEDVSPVENGELSNVMGVN